MCCFKRSAYTESLKPLAFESLYKKLSEIDFAFTDNVKIFAWGNVHVFRDFAFFAKVSSVRK